MPLRRELRMSNVDVMGKYSLLGRRFAVMTFRSLGGVEFRGLAFEYWLASIICLSEKIGCVDAWKLGCVVSMLLDDSDAISR
ncbi:hypothetical protein V6N13_050339 [Hibiscus sabdariffa]